MARTLSWASYNKPTSITAGATTETFLYGPSRERLQTTVSGAPGNPAGDIVTTTYIDGLFEQVQDSAGNITYKHYIIAGSARVGVETIATTGGTVNSDLLSFFVQDQVGSVIAEVTEGLYGTSQQLTIYSHDHWGKARPTSGTGANIALIPGVFQPDSAMMAGQHEGFAGHEDLEDIGIVDMEGRIYDPEMGRFLSPDSYVQYPNSSQGYNRYTYVNNNPISLSDPTGHFSVLQAAGLAAAIVMSCYGQEEGWAWYETSFASGAVGGYVGSGGNLQSGLISGVEAVAFSYAGDQVGWANDDVGLFEKSLTEGLIGGAFSAAGGGRFSDGFFGAFVSSEMGPAISGIDPGNYSPLAIGARTAVSAVVGGTVSSLTGGDFSDGAVAGAMQRLYNDESILSHANQTLDNSNIHAGQLAGSGFGTPEDARLAAAEQWGAAGIIANREANWFVVKIADGDYGYTYASVGPHVEIGSDATKDETQISLKISTNLKSNIVELGHNHLAGDLNFSGVDMQLLKVDTILHKYDLWMWNQYGHAYVMNYGMIEDSSIMQTYEGEPESKFNIQIPPH